ncbi:MAG: hypothetical protein LBT59_00870 [Clostridiales bacterium]|jgi:hypothetical protein|nr:hypothetical protein [Clostridiales bacterium]
MKSRFLAIAGVSLAVAIAFGVSATGRLKDEKAKRSQAIELANRELPPVSVRGAEDVDFSNLNWNPWDVGLALSEVETREEKPFTILVYMNGSDLESEDGAATDDLEEMSRAKLDETAASLVLFTGGASRWQNDTVSDQECALWEMSKGNLVKLASVGQRNMGDPGTLASFIQFGTQAFPAQKTMLVLWDHGGGSIAGYGQDENFRNSALTLLDLNLAFERGLYEMPKLELLGFDSCLMASVEMAVVAANYAKYMVASEDLEPGGGWDYSFLRELDGGMSGAELGIHVADAYMSQYGRNTNEILTMSLLDLSQAGAVMNSIGDLMKKAKNNVGDPSGFKVLAKKRRGTKTFGEGSPRDNESDMVDIGLMAESLQDLFPEEAQKVFEALGRTVIYNRHNLEEDAQGLSAFYIYGGKDLAEYTLPTYESLKMDEEYTNYLKSFYEMLSNAGHRSSSPSEPEFKEKALSAWTPIDTFDGEYTLVGIKSGELQPLKFWPKINGNPVCLYLVDSSERGEKLAAPARRNERDCDIMVSISDSNPGGRVLGARQKDGLVIQKGCDALEEGDEIAFYYLKRDFAKGQDIGWELGESFTVGKKGVTLAWESLPQDAKVSWQETDEFGNVSYQELENPERFEDAS